MLLYRSVDALIIFGKASLFVQLPTSKATGGVYIPQLLSWVGSRHPTQLIKLIQTHVPSCAAHFCLIPCTRSIAIALIRHYASQFPYRIPTPTLRTWRVLASLYRGDLVVEIYIPYSVPKYVEPAQNVAHFSVVMKSLVVQAPVSVRLGVALSVIQPWYEYWVLGELVGVGGLSANCVWISCIVAVIVCVSVW